MFTQSLLAFNIKITHLTRNIQSDIFIEPKYGNWTLEFAEFKYLPT